MEETGFLTVAAKEMEIQTCASCGYDQTGKGAFCTQCGSPIQSGQQKTENNSDGMITILSYYGIILLLSGIYNFSDWFDDSYRSLLVADVLFSVITIGFVVYSWKSIVRLLNPRKLSMVPLLQMLLIAVSGAVVVHFLAGALNHALWEEDTGYLPMFADAPYPWLLAVLSICVQPAIFEELAFRGFLYNSMEELSNTSSAIFLTSFLFGVIHFSIIGLFWLIPIGLLFAYFRMKHNTLWYGILGHFTYNLTILLMEYWTGGGF